MTSNRLNAFGAAFFAFVAVVLLITPTVSLAQILEPTPVAVETVAPPVEPVETPMEPLQATSVPTATATVGATATMVPAPAPVPTKGKATQPWKFTVDVACYFLAEMPQHPWARGIKWEALDSSGVVIKSVDALAKWKNVVEVNINQSVTLRWQAWAVDGQLHVLTPRGADAIPIVPPYVGGPVRVTFDWSERKDGPLGTQYVFNIKPCPGPVTPTVPTPTVPTPTATVVTRTPPTPTPTATVVTRTPPTPTPTGTVPPSRTPTATNPPPTATPTRTPTNTVEPSRTPSATATVWSSRTPTASPTPVGPSPTPEASRTPTGAHPSATPKTPPPSETPGRPGRPTRPIPEEDNRPGPTPALPEVPVPVTGIGDLALGLLSLAKWLAAALSALASAKFGLRAKRSA